MIFFFYFGQTHIFTHIHLSKSYSWIHGSFFLVCVGLGKAEGLSNFKKKKLSLYVATQISNVFCQNVVSESSKPVIAVFPFLCRLLFYNCVINIWST